MKDNKKNIEKELDKLTTNFELDLLRLIKTKSFISMSKDVMNNELNTLKEKSLNFQKKLKEFSIKTIEIEEEINSDIKTESDLVNIYLKKIRELLHDSRDYSDYISKDLNSGLTENIEKLDSLHQIYLNEMEEFRKELDERLGTLQKNLSQSLDTPSSDGIENVIENMEENDTEKKIFIGNDQFNSSEFEKENEIEFEDVEELTEADVIVDEIISKSEVKDFSENSNSSFGSTFVLILITAALFVGYYYFDKINEQLPILKKMIIDKSDDNTVDKENVLDSNNNESSRYLSNLDSNLKKINEKEVYYVINVEFEYIRNGPSIYYDSVATIKPDEKIKDLGEYNGQWLKVKTSDGIEGWLPTKSIKRYEEPK